VEREAHLLEAFFAGAQFIRAAREQSSDAWHSGRRDDRAKKSFTPPDWQAFRSLECQFDEFIGGHHAARARIRRATFPSRRNLSAE